MLYSPRSPSLGLKTNPPVPPYQGGKNDAPRRGGGRKAPLTRGDRGVTTPTRGYSTTLAPRDCIASLRKPIAHFPAFARMAREAIFATLRAKSRRTGRFSGLRAGRFRESIKSGPRGWTMKRSDEVTRVSESGFRTGDEAPPASVGKRSLLARVNRSFISRNSSEKSDKYR